MKLNYITTTIILTLGICVGLLTIISVMLYASSPSSDTPSETIMDSRKVYSYEMQIHNIDYTHRLIEASLLSGPLKDRENMRFLIPTEINIAQQQFMTQESVVVGIQSSGNVPFEELKVGSYIDVSFIANANGLFIVKSIALITR